MHAPGALPCRHGARASGMDGMSELRPLRVFISYSHDSRGHAARVAALSDRLRRDLIDCRIDQYYVRPPEGWPNWMNRQVDEADTILLVCTETYRRRFDRKEAPTSGRGVRWESLLMQAQISRLMNEDLSNGKPPGSLLGVP